MNVKRVSQRSFSLTVWIILMLGLSACSTQTAPAESQQVDASQARSITVYESPT